MTPPIAPQANLSQPQGLIVLAGESTVARAVSVALSGLEGTGPLVPGSGAIELFAPDQKRGQRRPARAGCPLP